MTLDVKFNHPGTDAVRNLATFRLTDGGGVVCHYHDPRFRRQVEVEGVWCEPEHKFVHPEDGAQFMEALKKQYTHSSTVTVTETP